MDVFTSFFCYAKKQKKGLVSYAKPATANQDNDGGEQLLFEQAKESEEADLLPVTNIGFRY